MIKGYFASYSGGAFYSLVIVSDIEYGIEDYVKVGVQNQETAIVSGVQKCLIQSCYHNGDDDTFVEYDGVKYWFSDCMRM